MAVVLGSRSHTLLGLLWLACSWSAWAAEPCTPALARVVSVQGKVELRRGGAEWAGVVLNAPLCSGDTLRVLPYGRAALLLSNETTLRLDQGTTLTLAPPEAGKATLLHQLSGALHMITRTPRAFNVKTPFVNANVEGTEFSVRVTEASATISVIEGVVLAVNDAGSERLASGEAATAMRDGAAPRKDLLIRPADAVAWTLFFPAVLDRGDKAAPAVGSAAARVDRAGELLQVGRVEEAKAEIAGALAMEPARSDAQALLSVVAVVQNDKDKALELAQLAVRADPNSAGAQIALSYAQQARFEIDQALASATAAARLDPSNALAHARRAELEMSVGAVDAAVATAQEAARLKPELAKAHSVLGFANLTRIDTRAARTAFERAIELDQADPLPRLGLGLAKIREGDLAGGREEIEIAAILDPGNSLVRSYLGKAYYEERRDAVAGVQFDLARALDPKDPTPWFYDAIRKQGQYRPVEALRDLEKSIELNDNRAVYRSRLLLDEDRASRGVSVARIYRDLGFNELAVVEASKSLAINPANHSAHRFLSDAYAELPRHEVARASALLQSQLLQPQSLPDAQPSAPFIDVSRVATSPFPQPGFNEYSSLYERDRSRVSVAALLGNDGAKGDEVVASILRKTLAVSLGQFHYQFDGFHPNGDVRHDIYNGFIQWAVSPSITLQAELRDRKTRHGDIAFDFDPNDFLFVSRVNISQQTARLGLAYEPSPRARWIASFMDNRRQERQHHEDSGLDIGLLGTSPGRQSEVQLQLLSQFGNLTMGLGSSRVRFDLQARIVDNVGVFGGACAPDAPCDSTELSTIRQSNGYLYLNLAPRHDATATLGLSRDAYTDAGQDLRVWNPKFGVRWQATDWLGMRAAAFKTVKRALIVDQTIEPTQIAGFNQFFDDINGTKTRTFAGALDLRLAPDFKALLETNRRRLRLGPTSVGADLSAGPFEEWQERTWVAGLFWSLRDRSAITMQYRRESFDREALVADDRPTFVLTHTTPITLRHFFPNRLSVQVGATYVRQRVVRLATSPKPGGEDSFVLVDAALGYRIPRLNASVNVAINNALDKHFSFQDDNFRSSQTHLPRYIPRRNIVLSVSLSF